MWKRDNTAIKLAGFVGGLTLIHALAVKADAQLEVVADLEYCAMVRIYDESNGLFGWEPYKGRAGCDKIKDQCSVMQEGAYMEWTKGVPHMEMVDTQCQAYLWYLNGNANDNFN